jgi:hypothetical protein
LKAIYYSEERSQFEYKLKQFWNFSLIFHKNNFDVIKWKNSIAWADKQEEVIDKGKFIGSSAGLFFFDVNDESSWINTQKMVEIFRSKTLHESHFLLVGLVENKVAIQNLKTNKEKLQDLGDIKKWVSQRNGTFKLENLAELKLNLTLFLNELSHFFLQNIKNLTDFSKVELKEVFYIDYEDLEDLKNIELMLESQAEAGESVDELLTELFLEHLKTPKVQVEDVSIDKPLKEGVKKIEKRVELLPIKKILKRISDDMRRMCPVCGNQNRKMIREVLDKKYVIMDYPRVYGTKLICGLCGAEWR